MAKLLTTPFHAPLGEISHPVDNEFNLHKLGFSAMKMKRELDEVVFELNRQLLVSTQFAGLFK